MGKYSGRRNKVIAAAIEAAGGPNAVGRALGLSASTVSSWPTKGSMPAKYIHNLVEAGDAVVSAERITASMAAAAPVDARA